ncbi:large subunit GTPase 1 [Sparganum proliferum]
MQVLRHEASFNTVDAKPANMIAAAEPILSQTEATDKTKNLIRHQVSFLLMAHRPRDVLSKVERDALKGIRADINLVIVPADKGRSTVVLDRTECTQKAKTLLEDRQSYVPCESNPIKTLTREINATLLAMENSGAISPIDRRMARPQETAVARLYDFPKVHKEGAPLRPIVSLKGIATYGQAQWLFQRLKFLTSDSNTTVSSSTQVLEKLKGDLAVETIELLLREKYDETENRLGYAQIIQLLKFCLKTYFTFDGTIYEHVKGTPMGSPISGLIAEAVLQRLESLVFRHHRPKFWARYVDDTFVVIERDQVLTFKEHLNAIFPDIQFTMEEEGNNQLAFLDVLVCRKDCGGLKTKVFRKATNTTQILNFNSNHPINHKRSCVRALYRRVEKHCSEMEDKVAELQYLRRVMRANGYPRSFVNQCIRKGHQRPNPTGPKFWRALPGKRNAARGTSIHLLSEQRDGKETGLHFFGILNSRYSTFSPKWLLHLTQQQAHEQQDAQKARIRTGSRQTTQTAKQNRSCRFALLLIQQDAFQPVETPDCCRLDFKSITEQTSLQEFLQTANLSNVDFSAQKLDVRVISKAELVGTISQAERCRRQQLVEENKHCLTILKRPKLVAGMSPRDVINAEQEAYLAWRRELARVEHIDGIVVTPYEKNLDIWRQLWQVVERSDVLVQVVDARQPLLFLSESLTKYVEEVDPRKRTLVLFNKADLLTDEQRAAWADYLESTGVRGLFFSALDQSQRLKHDISSPSPSSPPKATVDSEQAAEARQGTNHVPTGQGDCPPDGEKSVEEMCRDFDDQLETDSDSESDRRTLCDEGSEQEDAAGGTEEEDEPVEDDSPGIPHHLLSVNELVDILSKSGSPKPGAAYLTVGFVGYPNVGKSSTLNALCGAKKVSVSATPGRTKHFQTIFLQPDFQLCDCPGMVMPSFAHTREDLVVAGILPIDEMRDCIPPIRVICEQIPREVLSAVYGVNIPRPAEHEDQSRTPTPYEFLGAYARMRGFMTARGNPHYDRAARIVLKDYTKGRLRFCHPPPGMDGDAYRRLGVASSPCDAADDPGDTAAVPEAFTAFVAPSEVHKLADRLQHAAKRAANSESSSASSSSDTHETDAMVTAFDRMAFTTDSRGARQLVRSNKKLPRPPGGLNEDEDEDTASVLSSSSWSTVSSAYSVGGASLLSGMASSATTALTGKKPWRQMSAIKKQQQPQPSIPEGRRKGVKKREKLRRVYADLDKHEVI